tara:strand:+ start:6064 stop:6780 length:717 start_codon:yes stop_codon:yes gene_type:complete
MARRKTKRLLSEGEMRRFAKLANLSPVNEMYGVPGARDEEEEEPGMRDGMMQEEEHEEMEVSADEVEAEPAPMDAMDDMPEEPEMDMDMDMDAPAGGEGMVDIEDFMSALESALEEVTGEEVSTEMDMGDEEAPDEGGEELDMEMSPEPAMDMDMGDEEDEMPDMDELAEAIARRVRRRMNENRRPAKRTRNKAKTVDAVTNRVMKRINEEKKQAESLDKRADALTDRIFARLMKESR